MGTRSQVVAAPRTGQFALSFSMIVVIVASFFASVAGIVSASAQSTDTALAETVPAESVIYIDVDLDQTSDQWTQVYALLERAGLSDLAEEEAQTSPEDLGNLAEMYEFTGSAALVFTSAEGLNMSTFNDVTDQAMEATTDPGSMTQDIPEGLVVVFQPDDPAALHANLQQQVADEAESNGGVAETVDYSGVTIDFWTSDDPSVAPTATALVGETVVLAVTPEDIEPVIDTVNGDIESLATNENFVAVSSAFTTESISFAYIDGTTIATSAIATDPTLAEATAGLDVSQAGYAGWNLYVDDLGFRMDTVMISEDGTTPTLLDPTLDGQMPGDSLMFVNGTDIAGSGFSDLLGAFLQLALSESDSMDEATVTATPTVDEVYSELESQLGFNIKTDLIDQLDGEWALAGNAEQLFSDEPQFDLVFVSEVADETIVADTTDQISFLIGSQLEESAGTIEEREVEGGTVTTVTVVDGISPGVPLVVEWAVINGELLVGVNNGIDNYLTGSAGVLADDPVYQQTREALPATDLVSVQFLNLERTIPMIEEAVVSMESSTSVLDNDMACGDYASQEEAQAAYDEDEFDLWNLDLDYDGEACEDFFAPVDASPVASPVSMTEDLNILSAGSVSYVDGDMYRTSSIILIGE